MSDKSREEGSAQGTIPSIVQNRENLYIGNLVHYFRVVFNHARNLDNPYHNFRHLFHMLWLCHEACRYYAGALTPREMRDLLIAALFHDFDHSGKAGNDDLNIEIAIRGLKKHVAPEDVHHFEAICDIIRPTQYPYTVQTETLSLSGRIMRDADMSQAFSTAWIQQVIFGLAKEWGMPPIKVLSMQEGFLSSVTFSTEWAKKMFSEEAVKQKIVEARDLLNLLNGQ